MTGGATCSRPFEISDHSRGCKVVIDVGSKEFCIGLTFVACSHARRLTDFNFDRISTKGRKTGLETSISACFNNENIRLSSCLHCFPWLLMCIVKGNLITTKHKIKGKYT